VGNGYLIRLGDGSEIGPMDLKAVKDWYTQGLIGPESPVRPPGARAWSTARAVLDKTSAGSRRLGAGPKAPTSPARASAAGGATRDGTARPRGGSARGPAHLYVAGFALLILAGGAAFVSIQPQYLPVEIAGAPWLAIAAALAVVGLALLTAREAVRVVARAVLAVIAAGLLPLAGFWLWRDGPGVTLYAPLAVTLVLAGVAIALTERPALLYSFVGVLVVAGGVMTAQRFVLAPEGESGRRLRDWASTTQSYSDSELGVTLELPRGWILLRDGNPYVAPVSGTRITFAHPRLGAYGMLVAESPPDGAPTLAGQAGRMREQRRAALKPLEQTGSADARIGALPALRIAGALEREGQRFSEAMLVWRDGWVYFALAAWVPEGGPRGEKALDELLKGVSSAGHKEAALTAALDKVTREVPMLSARAAQTLMARSEAHVLEPDQAFKRAFDRLCRALPGFSRARSAELGQLLSSVYGGLSSQERQRLAGYVDRLRRQELTSPTEDLAMAGLMKSGVLRMGEQRQSQLRGIFDETLGAAPSS
jgi:hypothetical protein